MPINWIPTTSRGTDICCQTVVLCGCCICHHEATMIVSSDVMGHVMMTCTSITKRRLPRYSFQLITLWNTISSCFGGRELFAILNSPRDSRYFDLSIFLVFLGSSRRTSTCFSKIDHDCFVLLTNRLHGEKLTDSQLVNKFRTFYGTSRSITALSTARHLNIP